MASGIEVFTPVSHTLFDPAEIIKKVFETLKLLLVLFSTCELTTQYSQPNVLN